jgi:drug/metabolite transporter (DMT)-like permease
MTTQGGQDRFYAALNPLVMDGTLTPQQADRVYQAVRQETAISPTGPAVAASGGWDRQRIFAAGSVLAAGLLATAYVVGTVVDERKDTTWKSTVMMIGTSLVVAAAAAAWLFLLRNATWSRWVSGLLGALGLAGLAFSLLVMWGSDAAVYITGIVMLAGGAAGFWFLKGQLYTLVTSSRSVSRSCSTASRSGRPAGSSGRVGCSGSPGSPSPGSRCSW